MYSNTLANHIFRNAFTCTQMRKTDELFKSNFLLMRAQIVSGTLEAFKAQGEEKVKSIKSLQEYLTFLEKQIEGKKFFGGEKIGYLDLVVGWVSHWLKSMEEVGEMKLIEAEKFPFLHKWCDNFVEFPLIKECLPPKDDILKRFHGQLISFRNSLEPKK